MLDKIDNQLQHTESLLKELTKESKKTDAKPEKLSTLMTGVLKDASDIQGQITTFKGNLPTTLTPARIQAIISTITTLDRALIEDYVGEIQDAERWKERALRDFRIILEKLRRGQKTAASEFDKQG